MPASWRVFDSFVPKIVDGTVDLLNDTFKVALFSSTLVPVATDDSYSSLAGELATEYGYTQGGQVTTGVAFSAVGGVHTFEMDNPLWAVSGGSIVARFAVLYDDTDSGKQLVASLLLDETPADVTIPSGENLEITARIFSLTEGW